MTGITLSRLKTGEQAFCIGAMAYAVVGTDDNLRVMDHYNPARRSSEELSIDRFNRAPGFRDVDDIESFLQAMAEEVEDARQTKELGHEAIEVSTSTPRGKAQGGTRYTRGITMYDTAGHGYGKLSKTFNDAMPDILRNDDAWYEEDCEFSKVIYFYPQYFTDKQVKWAERSMVTWFPDEYEALTGKEIPPGASLKKDEREFERAHEDDYVVISAIGSDIHEDMVECIAVLGGRRQRHDGPEVEEKMFLVPSDEYQSRSSFGFVIDPDVHEEVDALPRFPGRR